MVGRVFLDLGNDFVDRPHALLALEKGRDRAERAGETTATTVLHERHRQVALAVEQVPTCRQTAGLRIRGRSLVADSQCTAPRVLDDLRPYCLRIAHDDGHTALAVLSGYLVGASRVVNLDCNRGKICRLVESDRFHAVVIQHTFDVGRRIGGEYAKRQRLHAALIDVRPVEQATDIGPDERHFQSYAPAPSTAPRRRPCLRKISRRDFRLAAM